MESYHNKEYEVAIHFLEESLLGYLMAQDECRAFCESEFDHGGWQPDFVSAIGSKFRFFCVFKTLMSLNHPFNHRSLCLRTVL